jgi:hypothetical protein
MSQVFIRVDRGGYALSDQNEATALAAGCVGLSFGEFEPKDAVWVGHSTTGWTGVYRNGERLKRFQSFERALKFAQRAAA